MWAGLTHKHTHARRPAHGGSEPALCLVREGASCLWWFAPGGGRRGAWRRGLLLRGDVAVAFEELRQVVLAHGAVGRRALCAADGVLSTVCQHSQETTLSQHEGGSVRTAKKVWRGGVALWGTLLRLSVAGGSWLYRRGGGAVATLGPWREVLLFLPEHISHGHPAPLTTTLGCLELDRKRRAVFGTRPLLTSHSQRVLSSPQPTPVRTLRVNRA